MKFSQLMPPDTKAAMDKDFISLVSLLTGQETPHACSQVLSWCSLVPIDFINHGAFSGEMMPKKKNKGVIFSFLFSKKRETQKENNRKIWVHKTSFKQLERKSQIWLTVENPRIWHQICF